MYVNLELCGRETVSNELEKNGEETALVHLEFLSQKICRKY
jgi:hypothetical protein